MPSSLDQTPVATANMVPAKQVGDARCYTHPMRDPTTPSRPQGRPLMNVEDYLKLEEISPLRHEYIAGMLYEMPGTTKRHNRLVGNLLRALQDAEDQGCVTYFETVKVTPAADVFYYPDLVVVCGDDGEDERIAENPCLIVEVLSDTTEETDRREKWAAYRQIESLQSYLLIHQIHRQIDAFFRQTDGSWQFQEVTEGGLELTSPKIHITLDAVFREVI